MDVQGTYLLHPKVPTLGTLAFAVTGINVTGISPIAFWSPMPTPHTCTLAIGLHGNWPLPFASSQVMVCLIVQIRLPRELAWPMAMRDPVSSD